MPGTPIDDYLDDVEEPARSTLRQLRDAIAELVPEAEQDLAYGAPAFRLRGKTVAGFAASKHHLSYLPHSGSVLATLADDLADYETSKGALKFGADSPLPTSLVARSSSTPG